ncbi:MAG: hypothetical protein N4A72_00835 [Bacteroidales bacterium]|jgi:hypothetical protein|nr:hypothetical protein [Bacteroidales bacterium]
MITGVKEIKFVDPQDGKLKTLNSRLENNTYEYSSKKTKAGELINEKITGEIVCDKDKYDDIFNTLAKNRTVYVITTINNKYIFVGTSYSPAKFSHKYIASGLAKFQGYKYTIESEIPRG